MNKSIYLIPLCLLLFGCGAAFNPPVEKQDARTGELTSRSKSLSELPVPPEPIVVGVYNFKDQTGQYKNVENGSSFSTAVSQGATTMLIKALEDSNWFTPIERENFNNLLNERNIIRSTRDEFRKNNVSQPKLPPLLFAGILMEGGVISYDSNIITGGMGARYFGVGGSTQYRQDRLTIYLRAVSTANGKILKTVYISKTILSQAIDASLFRYVNFQRLLEVETGITTNEPVQLAMKDAIEKAVEALIIEGIQDELWSTAEGEATNKELVDAYQAQKEEDESTLLYDREQIPKSYRNFIQASGFATIMQSDYSKQPAGLGASLGYRRLLTDNFGVGVSGSYLNLKAGNSYSRDFVSVDLNFDFAILPYDRFGPYVYFGGGYLMDLDPPGNAEAKIPNEFKIQGGLGVTYQVSDNIGLKAFAEADYLFTDELELVDVGTVNDYYFTFGVGLSFGFGKSSFEVTEPTDITVPTDLEEPNTDNDQ